MSNYDPKKFPTLAKYKYRSQCANDSLFAFQCEELQERLDRLPVTFFTAAEFFRSQRNPNNVIPASQYDSVISSAVLTLTKLDKIRFFFGHGIIINSGNRNPTTNRMVKGVPTSLHQYGLAVDIRPSTPYMLRKLWRYIEVSEYFSEMILHDNYIHLGIK
ncbi:MAG: hypothetical protein K2K36_09775 [Muribaculaceae bacterium]|nr:hypothetical protein [Muribaculaceae bacterium]